MKHLLLIASLGLLGLGNTASAADKAMPAGVVTSLTGKVTLYPLAKAGKSADLRLGQQLMAGDRIMTGANGRAALVLTDGTQLRVNYNTDLTLQDKDSKGRASERGIASIKVALGDLWAKVTKKNSRLEFETSSAVAAVKGTTLELNVSLDELCAKLYEGKLNVGNDLGASDLVSLQMLCVSKGKAPGKPQAFDGKPTWSDSVGSATGAEVEVDYVDDQGQNKSLKLNYSK
jgi:hypothetical protein